MTEVDGIRLENGGSEEGIGRGRGEKGPNHRPTRALTSNRDFRRAASKGRGNALDKLECVDCILDRKVRVAVRSEEPKLSMSTL